PSLQFRRRHPSDHPGRYHGFPFHHGHAIAHPGRPRRNEESPITLHAHIRRLLLIESHARDERTFPAPGLPLSLRLRIRPLDPERLTRGPSRPMGSRGVPACPSALDTLSFRV